jgi:hypothetical protein
MAELKRIGVISAAKVGAGIGIIMGVIVGIIVFLAAFLGAGAAMMGTTGLPMASMGTGAAAGLIAFIIVLIFMAIWGFLYGAIGALIYNCAAHFFGGLDLELE